MMLGHWNRGTFMGAAWGPFRDVLKVWDEYFARKPYKVHSMGIASAPLSAVDLCKVCSCIASGGASAMFRVL